MTDGPAGTSHRDFPNAARNEILHLWELLSEDNRRALLRAARMFAHSEGLISDEEAAGDGDAESEISGIFSLGAHGYTSHLLRGMGPRVEAGPFDWLLSDPRMVADCLEDRLESLLDPAFYTHTAHPDGIGRGHLHFSPKYQRKVIFSHHDPTRTDDLTDLQRAEGRLNKALDSDRRYLFVIILDHDRGTRENIDRLHGALRKRNTKAELLAIIGSATALAGPTSTWLRSASGLHVYHVETASPVANGPAHANPTDDHLIKTIIRQHIDG